MPWLIERSALHAMRPRCENQTHYTIQVKCISLQAGVVVDDTGALSSSSSLSDGVVVVDGTAGIVVVVVVVVVVGVVVDVVVAASLTNSHASHRSFDNGYLITLTAYHS